MDDRMILNEEMPDSHGLTDEEAAELDAARERAWEEELAPYKAAAAQRKESAKIIAEHDNFLADMLFEMTMNELGEV